MNEQDQKLDSTDFSNTQEEPFISESILNTPAKDPKDINKAIPDNTVQNYLNINKPQQFKPQGEVVLDLDGKKVPVNNDTVSLETKSDLISEIYGDGTGSMDDTNNTGAFVIFGLVILGLFFFVYMNLKRTEYIMRLEKELEKVKKSI